VFRIQNIEQNPWGGTPSLMHLHKYTGWVFAHQIEIDLASQLSNQRDHLLNDLLKNNLASWKHFDIFEVSK
jgi:hypothetical protein